MLLDFIKNKKVQLYQANLNNGHSEALVYVLDMNFFCDHIANFVRMLSYEELLKANTYYTKTLSQRYIISHGMLRLILSSYTSQAPKDLQFLVNNYGKPFLRQSDICFNMSHSKNMVAYIVALNYCVGIDIEVIDLNINLGDFSNLVLTNTENDILNNLTFPQNIKCFYNIWTRKEALVKAIGLGLNYSINTIETDQELCFEQNSYHSSLLPSMISDYVVSIAANTTIGLINII